MKVEHSLKIVTKLNRETKEGKVIWATDRATPSSLSGSDELLDLVYTTTILDSNLRLYKFQYKAYYDEGLFEWSENYKLEFIDKSGVSLWAFPIDSSIFDLYDSVRFKTSNIDKFMESYLDKSDSDDDFKIIF